jgi:MFS family permease
MVQDLDKNNTIAQEMNEDAYPSARRAWAVTLLLTIAFIFSFIDRQILNLLVGPIQEDLGLSDTQVSLLQGFAFVSTYILLSVPIGRLVDTKRRMSILAGGIAFWSLATAACGATKSFGGLFAARAGVGIGEATLTPAAWSLLADYFPPRKRILPFSIFLTGPYLGAGIAMILGGLVMEALLAHGDLQFPVLGPVAAWQATFMVVAAPGLLLSVIVFFVREPLRKGLQTATPVAAPMSDIVSWVRQNGRIYSALMLGIPCVTLVLYGLQAWIPTYLLRVQEMSLVEAGTKYGSIALIAGSLGVLTGPVIGSFLWRRGYYDFQLRVAMISLLLIPPVLACLAFATNANAALFFIAIVSFLVPLPLALVATCIQSVTPNQMRGVMVGTHVVTVNVIGLALGPTLVAFSTDYIFSDRLAVGYSLALVGTVACLIGMVLVGRALRPLGEMIKSQESASSN